MDFLLSLLELEISLVSLVVECSMMFDVITFIECVCQGNVSKKMNPDSFTFFSSKILL